MTFNEMIVKGLLENTHHNGKENAIRVCVIMDHIKRDWDVDLSDSVVRACAKSLLENHDVPIGSCNHGLYIITSEEEARDTIENLQSRIMSMHKRIKVLKRITRKFKASNGQIGMGI